MAQADITRSYELCLKHVKANKHENYDTVLLQIESEKFRESLFYCRNAWRR